MNLQVRSVNVFSQQLINSPIEQDLRSNQDTKPLLFVIDCAAIQPYRLRQGGMTIDQIFGELAADEQISRRARIELGALQSDLMGGDDLLALRLKSGLNQDDATKVGLSQAQLSRYENGRSDIGIDNIGALAKLYGVSVGVVAEAAARTREARSGKSIV
jgi:hypothetical protein